jgi:hypothetical protein
VFGFLRPVPVVPVFGADAEDVTAPAAENVAAVFNSLVKNGTPRENALRYCLQCIIALFAEDVDLLPDHLFTRLINDCSEKKGNSYDLIGGLFQEMNREGRTPAGRYKDVDYFNGGLFAQTNPIELNDYQISLLQFAAKRNWRNVNPSIFGSIFKAGLEKGERHLLGQHYTREIDIKKIVDPVIVQPWSERIEAAETLDDLNDLLNALCRFRVLDPACGSGNFLFMAFREMKLLEKCLLTLVRDRSTTRDQGRQLRAFLETYPFVNTQQFYGIDVTTAPSKSPAKTPPHPPRNPGQSGARCLWFCPGHRPAHAQPRNRRARTGWVAGSVAGPTRRCRGCCPVHNGRLRAVFGMIGQFSCFCIGPLLTHMAVNY